MADLFKESELSDIRQTISPIQSVDLSSLRPEFSRLFGAQEQSEEAARNLALEQSFRGAEQQRQRQLGQVSGAIGQSALGAAGEALTEGADIQRTFNLTSKEVAKTLEPEIQKRARIENLKQQMVSRQVNDFNRTFNKEAQTFNRKVQDFSRTLANRMFEEQEEIRKRQDQQFDSAVENLKKKLTRRTIGRKLFSSLGQIGGGLIGFFGGGGLPGAAAGIRIGGSLFGGASNIFSSRRPISTGF